MQCMQPGGRVPMPTANHAHPSVWDVAPRAMPTCPAQQSNRCGLSREKPQAPPACAPCRVASGGACYRLLASNRTHVHKAASTGWSAPAAQQIRAAAPLQLWCTSVLLRLSILPNRAPPGSLKSTSSCSAATYCRSCRYTTIRPSSSSTVGRRGGVGWGGGAPGWCVWGM